MKTTSETIYEQLKFGAEMDFVNENQHSLVTQR